MTAPGPGSRRARAVAPAKLNLWLDVLRRRPDGFHEVDTGMVAIDLADELEVERTEEPGVSLRLAGPALTPDVPSGPSNLAARAASLVLEHAGAGGGLALTLTKRVPSGAGLGGGSSDAAAALLAASAVLGSDVPAALARSWLAGLGSDCVFFLEAAATGFARCKGRGELVRPLPVTDPAWTFALLVPAVRAPTAAVYRALARGLSGGSASSSVPNRPFSCPENALRLGLRNRLEVAALEAVPALRPWRELLDDHHARHFVLSGSGSTFFGAFREEGNAERCLGSLVRAAAERGLEPALHLLARPACAGARLVP